MTQKLKQMKDQPWYNAGLRFECTGCGQCCTGAPGHVWVSPEEMRAMAAELKISVGEFSRRYTRRVGDKISLLEDSRNYDCVFLEGGKCSIYAVRPEQCRTFPWWSQNLESPRAWRRAARDCEGISDEGELVPLETIEAQRAHQEAMNETYA